MFKDNLPFHLFKQKYSFICLIFFSILFKEKKIENGRTCLHKILVVLIFFFRNG